MSAWPQSIARVIRRTERPAAAADVPVEAASQPQEQLDVRPIEISPNDPIVAYFQSAPGAVDLEELELESPALVALREAGVKLAVPLVSQGELVGLLNLGPRLSDQDYSSDDRKLLDSLAAQAAPALQVAQLVRRQEAEARSRERIEQELRVATTIQQNFLPRHLPDLPGWDVSAYYRPAREVGGDFYDFIELPEGHIGIVIGDVTDKGVPAAMVMAATRSVLRASAQRVVSPGEVLGRVNDLMCPDMPSKMFVTCLYGVLEPATGPLHLRERRPQPPLRAHRRRLHRAARDRDAARAAAGDRLRGDRGAARARPDDAPPLRRRRRGARAGEGDVRLPAAPGRGGRAQRARRGDRPRAHRARPLHRLPTGSRRTTSRSSR